MGTSLIPIKGISQAQKRSLKSSCNISDIASLLTNGKTPAQRQTIADKLKTDRRYVDIWVKQAALWSVEGMTEDFAYLLIVAGIRSSLDLARIDIDATRIALKAVSNAHPYHDYDESNLSSLKYAAESLNLNSDDTIPVFDENDPEPRHLFAKSGIDVSSFGNVAKITVTVTLSNGQSYENTTTFPAFQSDGGTSSSSGQRPTGRVDHPDGKGSIANTSGRVDHPDGIGSLANGNNSSGGSSTKPSGRVDHPGMTGGSSSSKKESSNKKSGSTGRRR